MTSALIQNHWLTYSVAQEQGYKYLNRPEKVLLHPTIEDVHLIQTINPSTHLFILADGHGGPDAPRFFVSRIGQGISEILNRQSWDLSSDSDREELKAEIKYLFKILDAEYAALKVAQYREWMDNGNVAKPFDDGCTMVVNIIMDRWLINCNVGDSRSLLGCQPAGSSLNFPLDDEASKTNDDDSDDEPLISNKGHWSVDFASVDHNMTHPQKVIHIDKNGGRFFDPYTSMMMFARIDEERPRQYVELANARVCRPMSPAIRAVGCSHRRTLNLTATMGDLLFKIEPAVLSCEPDIVIRELDPSKNYVLIAATDGLWDHLKVQADHVQNRDILSFVSSQIPPSLMPVVVSETSSSSQEDNISFGSGVTLIEDQANSIQRKSEERDTTSGLDTPENSLGDVWSLQADKEPISSDEDDLPTLSSEASSPEHASLDDDDDDTRESNPGGRRGASKRNKSSASSSGRNARHLAMEDFLRRMEIQSTLTQLAEALTRREVHGTPFEETGMFTPALTRYDDATCMIVYLEASNGTARLVPSRVSSSVPSGVGSNASMAALAASFSDGCLEDEMGNPVDALFLDGTDNYLISSLETEDTPIGTDVTPLGGLVGAGDDLLIATKKMRTGIAPSPAR